MPHQKNLMYISLNTGHHFGISCIVGSFLERDDFNLDTWSSFRDCLKRQLTVRCQSQTEVLTLSIQHLNEMKNEFRRAYQSLFENGFANHRRVIRVKLKAIQFAQKYILNGTQADCNSYDEKTLKSLKFEPIEQINVENLSDDGESSSSSDSFSSHSLSSDEFQRTKKRHENGENCGQKKLPPYTFHYFVNKKKINK